MTPERREKLREAQRRWKEKNPDRARELSRKYAAKNKDARYETTRLWYRRLRAEVIAAYGARCSCCAEANPGFLTMDHINSDGFKERSLTPNGNRQGGSGVALYQKLRKGGFPKGEHQLLCWNCNCGRAANGGVCPHKEL